MSVPERTADPTLAALSGPVGVDYQSPLPAVAHSLPAGLSTVWAGCGVNVHSMIPVKYACWFAVPCRECFPDAPPPGLRRMYTKPDSVTQAWFHDPGLAWQTAGHDDQEG